MKQVILFLAFLVPTISFSQSQFEFFVSPDFSFRNITSDGLVESSRKSEKGKLNTHLGVSYYQKIKENLWLKIGVGFVSTGYKSKKYDDLRFGSQVDSSGNFDPTIDPGESVQFKYNFHFLEVPIALRKDFSNKKFGTFAEFGLSTMYYLQSFTRRVKSGKNETESFREDVINQIQFAPILSFGFRYLINEKVEIVARPNLRYHLTKMADAPVKENAWSAGLAIGIRAQL